MMTLYSPDNSPLMQISALERSGNELLVKGKVFGTMPVTARAPTGTMTRAPTAGGGSPAGTP